MKIVITCGGTGGHIYPALAIAEQFPAEETVFIGSNRRLESSIIPQTGYGFHAIPASNRNPFIILAALIKSLYLLLIYRPQFVVSTGGYITLPVCLAAIMLRKKIILQEQNTIPGKVNRIIGKFAYRIALGFPTPENYFPETKTVITGNPVRQDFVTTTRNLSNKLVFPSTDIPVNLPKVLFIGGSQGAEIFNTTITNYLNNDPALKDCLLILITGNKKYTSTVDKLLQNDSINLQFNDEHYCHIKYKNNLHLLIYPYLKNINSIMQLSDIIVARAGASTLTEISAIGKPSILVPYPWASDNHQYWNAKLFEDKSASIIIPNKELSCEKLENIIKSLLTDSNKCHKMKSQSKLLYKKDAAKTIAHIISNKFI